MKSINKSNSPRSPLNLRGDECVIAAFFKFMADFLPAICLLLIFVPAVLADTSIINDYDANGNLISGDGKYYEYNDANQLVKVRQGDQSRAVIAEYFYDAAGQRIKKIESGVVTYYVGKHFETQVGGANEGNSSYYFADGERVARKDPAGNIYYYHLNHIGSTTAITDNNGSLYGTTITYTPFGEIREAAGNEKYSYTGKEKDKTDLYYFDARYNSPEFRHFTQADIEEPDLDDPQDLNRYSYVGNNPLSYVDPDGHKKKHLSKREQRARSLGLNPDKDKYKVGKMSDREFKKALKAHEAAKKKQTVAKSSTASSSKTNYTFADQGKAWDDYIHSNHTSIGQNNLSEEDEYDSKMINKGMDKFNKFLNRNILSLPEHIPIAGCAFTVLNDDANSARGKKMLHRFTNWVTNGILRRNPEFFIRLGEGSVLAFEIEEALYNAEEKLEDWGIPTDVLSCIE
jgi:RHS repeat-associated protein